MKITASRRDDILKRRAEYEENYAKYKARKNELAEQFYSAEGAITNKVKDKVLNLLSDLDLLTFNVRVRRGYTHMSQDTVEVDINCKSEALKWDYSAQINRDGELETSTNSWSGLSATTVDEIDSLKQTVEALDRLSKIDWEPIISGLDLPEYRDYIDPENIEPKREDFDAQLRDAEFYDVLGEDKIIKVENYPDSPYWGRYLWVKVEGETPAFWKIRAISNVAVMSPGEGHTIKDYLDEHIYRVKKSNLIPAEPVEIKEI